MRTFCRTGGDNVSSLGCEALVWPIYGNTYGSTRQRGPLHPNRKGKLIVWSQSASAPAAAACSRCERFWNTAHLHLNAWAMVVNGAPRVSSWHATDNATLPRPARGL